jgi:glycosyltransferase involved in cell wall biosynthesis
MISIIVPAHNESSVIARTLSTLVGGLGPDEAEVIVVCNGCADDTAGIARRFGPSVRIVESDVASKTQALNLGDQISRAFPRIYADADIVITGEAVRALASRLERGDVLAVAPTPDVNLTDCSWLVRKYFGVRSLLPSSREGIGGSGVYALSEIGRRRFADFPEVIADDAYVRLQFKPEERETLANVMSTVFAPRAIKQLIRVRARAHSGMFQLAHRFPELWVNKMEANNRTLIGLFKKPRLWLGLLIYSYINILAQCLAKFHGTIGPLVWRRDDTSRVAAHSVSST